MSNFDDGIVSNVSDNPSLHEVITGRVSRRGVIGGGLATGTFAAMGGVSALLSAMPAGAT